MLLLIPALLLLAGLPRTAGAAESPEGREITEVRFVYRDPATGAEQPVLSPSPRLLAQAVRLEVGGPFSEEDAEADREELAREHGMSCLEVRPETVPDGVRVTYVFEQAPRAWAIEIRPEEGAARVRTGRLMEHAVTLRQDDRVTPARLEADRSRIVHYLRRQGYYFATARARHTPLPARVGYTTVHFRVDRGPRVRPKYISVSGNKAFSDRELTRLMETRVDTFWTRRRFVDVIYREDLDAIEEHYQAGGWNDVAVTARPTLFDPEEVMIFVQYEQREGRDVVTSVRITGARTVSRRTIRDRMLTRPGQEFSVERLRRDLQWLKARYYEHGLGALPEDATVAAAGGTAVLNVVFSYARETVVVDIPIDEDGRAGRIEARTTGPFTNEQIAAIVPLAAGDPVTDTSALHAAQAIARFYVRSEPPERHALVDYRMRTTPDGRRLTLEFIRRPETVRPVDAHLRIQVDEGPRYRVGAVSIAGIEPAEEARIRDRLRVGEGDPYSPAGISRDASIVRSTLQERGYAEAEVSETATPRPEEHLFDIRYEIEPGPVYYINVVRISGNEKTRAEVIEREMMVGRREPGPERFDVRRIAQQAERLRRTGYFEDVEITPIPSPRREDDMHFKDLHVEVREAVTRRLFLGAGAGTGVGLFGDIRLRDTNFDITDHPRSWSDFISGKAYAGGGQQLDIYARVGSQFLETGVGWHEPWLRDRPVELGVRAFYRTEYRDTYDLDRLVGEVTLGRRFGIDQELTAYLRARAQRAQVKSIDRDAPTDVWDDRGWHTIPSVAAGLTRDTITGRPFPTAGSRYTLEAELIGSPSFDAVKLRAEGRTYKTIYEAEDESKHVVSLWGGLASIVGSDVPVFERLYAGGLGSVRGFEGYTISPRNSRIYQNPPGGATQPVVGSGDPIGGRFLVQGGVEYMFPIIKDRLQGVAFVDVGSVAKKSTGVGDAVSDLRVSTGIGARFAHMGQVPIAVYLGFPVRRVSGDKREVFSFSIGLHWP